MPRKGLCDAFESGDTGNRTGLAGPAGIRKRPLSVQPPAEAGREARYLEGLAGQFNRFGERKRDAGRHQVPAGMLRFDTQFWLAKGGVAMIVQFVQFETSLSEEEVMTVAEERAPEFRAIPSLVQKYYLKLDKPNQYGGFYIWESPEALAKFRDSDLAKSIPAAYKIVGAPDVSVYEVMFPLRP
jgi:heme-degrading monooxygenase HmoA